MTGNLLRLFIRAEHQPTLGGINFRETRWSESRRISRAELKRRRSGAKRYDEKTNDRLPTRDTPSSPLRRIHHGFSTLLTLDFRNFH